MWSIDRPEHLGRVGPQHRQRPRRASRTSPPSPRRSRSSTAQGDISVGEEVIIQPTRGRKQRVRIVALGPQRRLETELALPGAIMRFGYEIEPHDQGCSIRHTVAMVGPLSSAYGLVVRRRDQRELARETARFRERFADSATTSGP